MSNNAARAENQQGSHPSIRWTDPSETTRRAPFNEREVKSYLLGALHDGTFSSNKRFRISQKGTEWLEILKGLFKRIGYNSWIYKEGKDRDVYILETLANFLDFGFNPLQCNTRAEKIGYIRGFCDAEGGIPKKNTDRFYIQLVQKDKPKLEKLKCMLKTLGIKVGKIHNPSKRIDPDYWRFFVSRESHKDFCTYVSTWHPRKQQILRKRMMI